MLRFKLTYLLLIISLACSAQAPDLNFVRFIGTPQPISQYLHFEKSNSVDYDLLGNMYVTGNTLGEINVVNVDSNAQVLVTNDSIGAFVYKYSSGGGIAFAFTIDHAIGKQIQSTQDGGCYVSLSAYHKSIPIDVDPGPGITSYGPYSDRHPAIMAKYDNIGQLEWSFALEDYRMDSMSIEFTKDLSDNFYIVGSIFDSIDIDPSPSVQNLYSSNAFQNAFVAKYDPLGQLLWGFKLEDCSFGIGSLGNSGNAVLSPTKKIAINSDNSLVCFGRLKENTDVDPSLSTTIASTLNGRSLVVTYDSNGNFVNTFNFGDTTNTYSNSQLIPRYTHLRLDGDDNIYIKGKNNDGDFDPGTATYNIPHTNTNLPHIREEHLVSFTKTGSFRWLVEFPSTHYVTSQNFGTQGLHSYSNASWNEASFDIDPFGNTYLPLSINKIYDVDRGVDTTLHWTFGLTKNNYVIAKYNKNGKFVNSFEVVDTSSNVANDTGEYPLHLCPIKVDDNCRLYIVGATRINTVDSNINIHSDTSIVPINLPWGPSFAKDAINISYSDHVPNAPRFVRGESKIKICIGDSAHIVVAGAGTIQWYDSLVGGNLIHSGSTYTTPQLFQNISYYIQDSTCARSLSRTVVTIDVIDLDSTVTVGNDTLWSNDNNATYQWFDCNTNQPLPGQTNQYLEILNGGSYAVEVSFDSCFKRSSCVFVIPTKMTNLKENSYVNLYPNPVNNEIRVSLPINFQRVKYTLINPQGSILLHGEIGNSIGHSIDIRHLNLSPGLYVLKLDELGSFKILKN